MLSKEPRCHYGISPLAEVICQFRFPEILSIESKAPADFQEAIRDTFPLFQRRQEIPAPKLTGVPGNLSVLRQNPVTNYQFSSADGIWRVNLTGTFISLSCSRYSCWEEFAGHLDKPLAAFIRLYKPAHFDRIGLRYVNFLSRASLGLENVPFRDLIRACYLGPLALDSVSEAVVSKATVDFETALRGGCRAKIHAGPGLVKRNGQSDQEIKFIFDQDLYMPGPLALNLSAGALHTLHAQAFSLFRGAITDALHEAMEPER